MLRIGLHVGLSYEFGRGVAQPGRALGWGPSGRWFESSLPDQSYFLRESYKRLFLFNQKITLALIWIES